jgi:hypothetical protein
MIDITTATTETLSVIRSALQVPNTINGTFTSSVSAPALSGTFYGDGSNLTGVSTYTGSDLKSLSGNWQSTYNTVSSLSGGWQTAYQLVSTTNALSLSSSYWNTAYSIVSGGIVAPSPTLFPYTSGTSINNIKPVKGSNTASGYYSNVAGGVSNNASARYSNVAGGKNNTASGYCSNVAGGYGNNASEYFSNVAGGYSNIASGYSSNVAGGYGNNASEYFSNVAGGYSNIASGYFSNVAGGQNNTASGYCSNVAGGYGNIASGYSSNVAGGQNNTASGYCSNVAGGYGNNASGCYSSILGGNNNNTNNQACSFIIGQGITASQPNFTYVNNLSSQGSISSPSISAIKFYGDGSNLTGVSAINGVCQAGTGYIQLGIASAYTMTQLQGTATSNRTICLPDASGTVLLNTRVVVVSSDVPVSPEPGQIYFSSSDHHFYGYNGTAWKQLDN